MGRRPELFPTLLQKLQIPDVLATQRIYLVLNQTLKELSTKRLAADQRNFAEVCYLNQACHFLTLIKLNTSRISLGCQLPIASEMPMRSPSCIVPFNWSWFMLIF